MTPQFRETVIEAPSVGSLCWHGDELIDWINGVQVFRMDGSSEYRPIICAYRFDAAIMSRSGQYTLLYERLGTKALLLKQGKNVRQLNRDFYFANRYLYPLAFLTLPDGREAIAHCPDSWDRLEVEDAETGQRLIPASKRSGVFHSRLCADPTGRYLLDGGWVWHPEDYIQVFEVSRLLNDADYYDKHLVNRVGAVDQEVCGAFLDEHHYLAAHFDEGWDDDEDDELEQKIYALQTIRIEDGKQVASVIPEQAVGEMMAVDSNYVVGFYDHPHLIELSTGKTVASWDHIDSGKQTSSICLELPPPIALDQANRRFAVANDDKIHVIEFD